MKNYSRLNSHHEGYEIRTEFILRVRGEGETKIDKLKEGIDRAKNERRGAKVFTRNIESWLQDGVVVESPGEVNEVFSNGR